MAKVLLYPLGVGLQFALFVRLEDTMVADIDKQQKHLLKGNYMLFLRFLEYFILLILCIVSFSDKRIFLVYFILGIVTSLVFFVWAATYGYRKYKNNPIQLSFRTEPSSQQKGAGQNQSVPTEKKGIKAKVFGFFQTKKSKPKDLQAGQNAGGSDPDQKKQHMEDSEEEEDDNPEIQVGQPQHYYHRSGELRPNHDDLLQQLQDLGQQQKQEKLESKLNKKKEVEAEAANKDPPNRKGKDAIQEKEIEIQIDDIDYQSVIKQQKHSTSTKQPVGQPKALTKQKINQQ